MDETQDYIEYLIDKFEVEDGWDVIKEGIQHAIFLMDEKKYEEAKRIFEFLIDD